MNGRTPLVAALFAALVIACALPSAASAQVRVGGAVAVGGHHGAVAVGVGYRPYYRPYYGYYNPFYGPWFYPYFAWGYPGYPYYGGYYPGYYPYDVSASLRLQVTPRNTEVFIDGYYAGTVDDFDGFFQRLHLDPGEHDLQLYLAGHRSATQKVYLQPGNTFRVKHAMEPLAAGEPEPQRPEGATPQPAQAPPQARQGPGPVQRQPRTVPRSAPPSTPPTAPPTTPPTTPGTAPRAPQGPPPQSARESGYGSLMLRVQPGDTNIRIDGDRWEGPQGDERLVVQLSAGRHVVSIQKDGYRDYTTEVTVHGGDTATLNVALTRQ